jgi:trans-aconitate methyltransferase
VDFDPPIELEGTALIMVSRAQILQFWQKRAAIPDESSTRFHSAHTDYDVRALGAFCSPTVRVLEIGCGRCSLLNRLVSEFEVTAHGVDVVPGFLEAAINDPRLTTEVADAVTYDPTQDYDVIILAGLINSIPDKNERLKLYRRIAGRLSQSGVLFIKSQFGRSANVDVNAWSDALAADYQSHYPAIQLEAALLETVFSVEVVDAYPAALSPHLETKFFHLICRNTPR